MVFVLTMPYVRLIQVLDATRVVLDGSQRNHPQFKMHDIHAIQCIYVVINVKGTCLINL